MTSESQPTPDKSSGNFVMHEIARRHRATVRVFVGIAFVILLLLVLSLGFKITTDTAPDSSLIFALWLAMIAAAIGVIIFRRVRFARMRLEAIAALDGAQGVLGTMQRTTIIIAIACLCIALMGFVISVLSRDTGEFGDLWRAGVVRGAIIAVILLVGCYPRRAAWQGVVAALTNSVSTKPPVPFNDKS